MPLQTSLSTREESAIIALDGDLDANSAADFQKQVERAARQDPKRLVLDMTKLNYLSSAGLRQLVYAQQKLSDDVSIVLVGASTRVAQTIRLVGFDHSVSFMNEIPE